jgi:hypothetical protein
MNSNMHLFLLLVACLNLLCAVPNVLQGFDDVGLHQPQKPGGRPTWVQTPNLDKCVRQ